MGTQQQELVKKQMTVLLWLKSLYDFKGEGYEDSTFNEKYEAFVNVEDTDEFSDEEFYDYVEFWIEKGIVEKDDITDELSITKQGEELFAMVDSKKDKKAFKIIERETSDKKPIGVKDVYDFVKKSTDVIMFILGIILQVIKK